MKCFQKTIPDIACWRITSWCNRHCPFCYGPETQDLKTADVLRIIDLLSQHGVQALGITGGEPLIRPDIVSIMKHIKARGMIVCLTTNGDFFQKYRKAIQKYVDMIGLPFEGSMARIHNAVRGAGSFEAVVGALRVLGNKPTPQVHIGTVLTKQNYRDLPRLEKLLSQLHDSIVYWKIYELIYYPRRKRQSVDNLIPPKGSEKHVTSLGDFIGKEKIYYHTAQARSRSYFLINPNGDVVLPALEGEATADLNLGNLLRDDMAGVLRRWRKEVNVTDYHCQWCSVRFKKLAEFDTYKDYPMDLIFRQIVQKTASYYDVTQEYTRRHLAWMIPQALNVALKESLDQRMLVPLVILHDIGYSQLRHGNPFKAERRKAHMRIGATIAQKVLQDVHYPDKLTEKIVGFVARHDDWSFGKHEIFKKETVLGVLNDLDYISMLTDASFSFMASFLHKDGHALVDDLEHNEKLVNRPFVTETTRQLFYRCLAAQKKQLSSIIT